MIWSAYDSQLGIFILLHLIFHAMHRIFLYIQVEYNIYQKSIMQRVHSDVKFLNIPFCIFRLAFTR